MKWLIIIICPTIVSVAVERPCGWRWYNEIVEAEPSTIAQPISSLDKFQQWHRQLLSAAILDPINQDKVRAVLQANNYVLRQSVQFGKTMKQVLLQHPWLDETILNPPQQVARSIYWLTMEANRRKVINKLVADGNHLLFAYQSYDNLAKGMAHSLQDFSLQYRIPLLGISLDGSFLTAIKDNRLNNGKLKLPVSPALLLLNLTTGKLKPVAWGFISMDQLIIRLVEIADNHG